MPVTRLAPSPTGALHLGNVRTFLVNWALARQSGWRIVLRIEDLDTPRVKPGVMDLTVDLLRWLGMDWDAGPLVQSATPQPHVEAMEVLARAGIVYPSDLTRAQIEAAASAPQEGSHEVVFPASLRPPTIPGRFDDAHVCWRLFVRPGEVRFEDAFAGPQVFDVSRVIGDFVVWTRRAPDRPGQPAYQLAVVVDDDRQGVTEVVRGDDLLDSAARQMLVRRGLGIGREPRYTHLPLVLGPDRRRLAKRHGDTRLDTFRAGGTRAERVIGLVAHWCGMLENPREVSAPEFLAGFDLHKMPHEPVVLTAESLTWLSRRT
ncbi:MAG: glutamate--tRNA ligase family protein [Phycisphaerales bacterium]